ncbi:hypothetical protein cypCar_00024146 [Cyprinus carpio]|nr:hypothetical protein cypCar_00024146 [Cyprinus carpio]
MILCSASLSEMDGIGNTMQKKAAELERMAEVLVTGEQLRPLEVTVEPVLSANCWYHFALYTDSVCDEHKEFKDMKLFYRFRKDDGTFPLDCEAKVFMRGQRIYEKLMNTENTLLQTREEEGVTYERTLVALEFIDWLLQEGEMPTRQEAEHLGRRLLEHGIIQHVSNKHHFVDGGLLYQFRMNFRRRRRLIELLNERCRSIPENHDSPFCLRKQGSEGGNTSFLSDLVDTAVVIYSGR